MRGIIHIACSVKNYFEMNWFIRLQTCNTEPLFYLWMAEKVLAHARSFFHWLTTCSDRDKTRTLIKFQIPVSYHCRSIHLFGSQWEITRRRVGGIGIVTQDHKITKVQKSPFLTLRPRQNGRHFADDIFNGIFFNEKVWISIMISLWFVPSGPINNMPAMGQIMAWRRWGPKPLS